MIPDDDDVDVHGNGTGTGSTVFVGGRVLVDGEIRSVEVAVADGVIVGVASPGSADERDDRTVDLDGAVMVPGFVDTQCNGACGHDITADPTSIPAVAAALPQWGVTSFLPTVITSHADTRDAAIAEVGRLRASRATTASIGTSPTQSADAVGLHFEGPAISPQRVGTHDPALHAVPDPDEVARWIASGMVTMVTLAPELVGAPAMIDALVSAGVTVSMGHTDASADEARRALDAGVRGVTHLFNAMAPFAHRAPGPVGVAFDDDRVFAGLICDGVHVDPTVVRSAWRLLGAERTVLVTDGTAATGMADGDYTIGSTPIAVRDGAVRNERGDLAGSALAMIDAVNDLIDMTGCSLAEAATAASSTPARFVGLDDRGTIEAGRRADLVVLRDDGPRHVDVVATYVRGVRVWKSSS